MQTFDLEVFRSQLLRMEKPILHLRSELDEDLAQ